MESKERDKGKRADVGYCNKFLRAVVSDDDSKPEILSRIAQATVVFAKLKPIWRNNNVSLGSKVKLMRSLVISIFLYACESWTLTAELEKKHRSLRCDATGDYRTFHTRTMQPIRMFAERSRWPLENMMNS